MNKFILNEFSGEMHFDTMYLCVNTLSVFFERKHNVTRCAISFLFILFSYLQVFLSSVENREVIRMRKAHSKQSISPSLGKANANSALSIHLRFDPDVCHLSTFNKSTREKYFGFYYLFYQTSVENLLRYYMSIIDIQL